jgi:UDP-N-acetylglucosamine acyltransferase
VSIHPTALVDAGAQLADGVEIGPYSIIGPDVTIGDRTRLISHVVVEGPTTIAEDCVVHPFAALGGPPQVTFYNGEPTRLEIGARNVIREYVTMHRGTAQNRGVTSVGADGLYMAQAHVAHDCVVEDRVILAHAATLGGHVVVGEYAIIGGLAAVTKDVIPYGSAWGNHAHLEGLNLVGLKRRDFSRETINSLRAAYRMLFAEEGTFQERLTDTIETYQKVPQVMEITDFIRADASRPLCLPEREVFSSSVGSPAAAACRANCLNTARRRGGPIS